MKNKALVIKDTYYNQVIATTSTSLVLRSRPKRQGLLIGLGEKISDAICFRVLCETSEVNLAI